MLHILLEALVINLRILGPQRLDDFAKMSHVFLRPFLL
jgi:hypothetical protein